jgi:hypothetical protein
MSSRCREHRIGPRATSLGYRRAPPGRGRRRPWVGGSRPIAAAAISPQAPRVRARADVERQARRGRPARNCSRRRTTSCASSSTARASAYSGRPAARRRASATPSPRRAPDTRTPASAPGQPDRPIDQIRFRRRVTAAGMRPLNPNGLFPQPTSTCRPFTFNASESRAIYAHAAAQTEHNRPTWLRCEGGVIDSTGSSRACLLVQAALIQRSELRNR